MLHGFQSDDCMFGRVYAEGTKLLQIVHLDRLAYDKNSDSIYLQDASQAKIHFQSTHHRTITNTGTVTQMENAPSQVQWPTSKARIGLAADG